MLDDFIKSPAIANNWTRPYHNGVQQKALISHLDNLVTTIQQPVQ